jgi:hypothetical protein
MDDREKRGNELEDIVAKELGQRLEGKKFNREKLADGIFSLFGIHLPELYSPGIYPCGKPVAFIAQTLAADSKVSPALKPQLQRAYSSIIRPALQEEMISPSQVFIIHYTRNGVHAAHDSANTGPDPIIATNDPLNHILASTDDGIGVPSYIQRIAFWLDYAIAWYRNAKFPELMDRYSRIHVYVWNVNDNGSPIRGLGRGDTIDLHNEMGFDATTTSEAMINACVQHTCCHELFHLVQDMLVYDSNGNQVITFSTGGFYPWMEGMAELAPDFVSGWSNAWMEHWQYLVPLTIDAVPLPDAYTRACVLWRYACDRFSNMSKPAAGSFSARLYGSDIIKEILLLAQPGATIDWPTLFSWLRSHQPATQGWGFPAPAVHEKPGLGMYVPGKALVPKSMLLRGIGTPAGKDVYSDWLVANIVQDYRNMHDSRAFGYRDYDEAPGLPHTAAIIIGGVNSLPTGIDVPPWTARYYSFDMATKGGPVHLSITSEPLPGKTVKNPNLQVVVTDGFHVLTIIRDTAGTLDTVIEPTEMTFPYLNETIRDVFVIFAALTNGARYNISSV